MKVFACKLLLPTATALVAMRDEGVPKRTLLPNIIIVKYLIIKI